MKFSYRFSNLLGTVYKDGNVLFTPDGNRLVSPVGNRVTVFDIPGAKSETLPMATSRNIHHVALSPDGITLILVDEVGEAHICSLIGKSVIGKHHFHQPIGAICFSPDGKKVAVALGPKLILYHAPGKTMEFNTLTQYKLLFGPTAPILCIDWTSDSQAVCIGGEDKNARVLGAKKFSNLLHYSLGGHRDVVTGTFFMKDSLNVITVGMDGYVLVFNADTELDGLRLAPPKQEEADQKKTTKGGSHSGNNTEEKEEDKKVLYKLAGKHNHKEARGGEDHIPVTSAAYHKELRLLFTGFQDGNFFLHEMPYFNLVHSLRISDQLEENLSLDAAAFNLTGDWVGLGSRGQGSLLVWEWQSETLQLQQRGHFNSQTCLAYSPDGLLLATGGQDGEVKLWRTSGMYFKTFTEHTAPITSVCFTRSGKVVLSSSLDGTVRAFDLSKYRNFRTFTSPQPTQFSCLAVNPSGEIVCAASNDTFQIYVWSMKLGRLLDVLDGHESVISSLSFSAEQDLLASGSWDKTVKLWDIYGSKDARDTLELNSDVTAVAFRPDGQQLAAATLNAHISFWDVRLSSQTGDIKGRADLGYSRLEVDKVTAKQLAANKYFSSLCYTADGSCVLAAGRSKNVCIYSVADQLLLRKFQICSNFSLGGLQEFLDKSQLLEWGGQLEDGEGEGEPLPLPGVRNVDVGQRHFKPEVSVTAVQFSPTGQAWAAASTEGVQVYSQDAGLMFDPYLLDQSVTPEEVQAAVAGQDLARGLTLALRLSERPLLASVVEQVPVSDVPMLVSSLSGHYVERLLAFLTEELERTAHLQFYLVWLQQLLCRHLPRLKREASPAVKATLTHLHKNIIQKQALSRLCEQNKYAMSYILALARNKRKRANPDEEEEEKAAEDMESDAEVNGVATDVSSRTVGGSNTARHVTVERDSEDSAEEDEMEEHESSGNKSSENGDDDASEDGEENEDEEEEDSDDEEEMSEESDES